MNPTSKISALVLDSETKSSLAVCRSLGEAGITVYAASHLDFALAKFSSSATKRVTYPNPRKEPLLFRSTILKLLDTFRPDILIPNSDLTISLLADSYKDIQQKTTYPFINPQTLNQVLDKQNLLSTAQTLGISIPETLLIKEGALNQATKETISSFCYPAFLKPSFSETSIQNSYVKPPVVPVNSASQVFHFLATQKYSTASFLLQRKIEGNGVGVFALCKNGEPLTLFCHRRLLEKPPTGGISVLSESIPQDEAPVGEAKKLLKHFDWNGIAMVEFKKHRDGNYYLMEINPRFWGSLQLACDAGVHFPIYLVSQFVDTKKTASVKQQYPLPEQYKAHLRLRWILGTIDHFLILFRKKPLQTLQNVISENSLKLFPSKVKTYYETLRVSDPLPFFIELLLWLKSFIIK